MARLDYISAVQKMAQLLISHQFQSELCSGLATQNFIPANVDMFSAII